MAVAAIGTGLFVGWIATGAGGATATRWADCLLTAIAAGCACAACWRARSCHAGRQRLFWGLLGCATGAWALGELIWGYESVVLREADIPFPSWADVPFLAAIPLTVAALAAHPATTATLTRRTRWLLDALVAATALLFLGWTLVLAPMSHGSDVGTLTGIVSLAYPFGDVLIVFSVLLAIRGMGRDERRALWWLLGALCLMAVTDSTSFSYLASGGYTDPGLVDTGWFLAYLGIALAALSARPASAAAPADHPAPSLASLVAPLVLVLATLIVAAAEIRLGHHLDRVSRITAFSLIGLVLARQVVLAFEVLGPGHRGADTRAQRLEHVALGER